VPPRLDAGLFDREHDGKFGRERAQTRLVRPGACGPPPGSGLLLKEFPLRPGLAQQRCGRRREAEDHAPGNPGDGMRSPCRIEPFIAPAGAAPSPKRQITEA
jgi:hypothetical protein